MQARYVFENHQGSRVSMILVDTTLYVPAMAGRFEPVEFDDEKAAALAFNKVLSERYTPRLKWRIVEKHVGATSPPPPEYLVGYEPPPKEEDGEAAPAGDGVDITKHPLHRNGDRLLLNLEELPDDEELEALVAASLEKTKHLYLYARDVALLGLNAVELAAPDTLEELVIDAYDNTNTRQATCAIGDLAPAVNALAGLQRLFVIGDVLFSGPLKAPSLTRLSLLGDPLDPDAVRALAESELPMLLELELGLVSEAALPEASIVALAVVIATHPGLERLHVRGPHAAEVLAVLDEGACPRRVEIDGAIGDEAELVEEAERLASGALRELAVDLSELDEDTVARLAKAGLKVSAVEDAFTPEAYGAQQYRQVPA